MTTHPNYDELLQAEVNRRRTLEASGKPFQYWEWRGDDEAPFEQYWCDTCVGYYGVPHDWVHVDSITQRLIQCKNVSQSMWGQRQCACLFCVVAEEYGKLARAMAPQKVRIQVVLEGELEVHPGTEAWPGTSSPEECIAQERAYYIEGEGDIALFLEAMEFRPLSIDIVQ